MGRTTRRLADLYVVGKELEFDDGTGDPITVYIKKLNPVDQEKALKRANAERAKRVSLKNFPDSDEYKEEWSAIEDYDRDDLVQYLLMDERAKRQPVVEAELEGDDEWEEEGYLAGITEAWIGGLNDEYAKDPEHPEASRVFRDLERFADLVDSRLKGELESYQADLEDKSMLALQKMMFEKLLGLQASIAWLGEYRRCEVWLSVREEDKKTRYFQERGDVDELPAEIYNTLTTEYQNLSVDPLEGKDSEATEDSSL